MSPVTSCHLVVVAIVMLSMMLSSKVIDYAQDMGLDSTGQHDSVRLLFAVQCCIVERGLVW